MKILFVSSGNGKLGISPIVKAQGESIVKEGVDLDYFTIQGKGVRGYVNSILNLRSILKNGKKYDLIHAHYWLSGIVASLGGAKPLIVSLMGDDVKASPLFRWIIHIFYNFSWSAIIVKSQDMYETLKIKDAHIVSNGVNMEMFKPIDREIALEKVGWDRKKGHILFTANPNRGVKNFKLAKEAFNYLGNRNLELHYLKDIPHEEIPYYYNASSVVLLTSLWEGSPNAIKEAMACGVPIVSVDVGDVKELISQTKGCYITEFDYREIASKIDKALEFQGKTTGREDIAHLNSPKVAQKLIDIYKSVKGGR